MVLKTLTLKSFLIIFNCLNITSAIIHIIISLITFSEDQKTDHMLMNYLTMIVSALCCAAAVMENSCILKITANLFLSKIVVTIVLWIYSITKSLTFYVLFQMILHAAITCIAYYLEQKIELAKLNNLISTYTGVAAIPLDPPPHVRSDVI